MKGNYGYGGDALVITLMLVKPASRRGNLYSQSILKVLIIVSNNTGVH